MKFKGVSLVAAMTAAAFAGCATIQPLSCSEECSLRRLTCGGVSYGSSSGSGFNGSGDIVSYQSYSRGISCRPPQTQDEIAAVGQNESGAREKAEENKKAAAKNEWVVGSILLATLIGVTILVVSGLKSINNSSSP